MKKYFQLFSLLLFPVICFCQKDQRKAVFDTIPASMSIYRTDSATSVLRVIRGYEIYEDSVLTERLPGYTLAGKDTTFTIWEYLTEAWFVDYLDVNKKPIISPIAVWASKPERSTNMHPPRGF